MNELELKKEAHIQRKLECFVVDQPACDCGEYHPLCLRPPKLCLEGNQTRIYCWNCWAIEQEKQISPEQRAQQRAAKLQVLLPQTPICMTCGEMSLCTLELHHWLQQDFSDEVQVNCMNCHKLFSEAQYYHPTLLGEMPDLLAFVIKVLLALADEYELRAVRRRKLISELSRFLPTSKPGASS